MKPKRDPLRMRELEPGGPFVLPPTPCSDKRIEFLKRGNGILGFYLTVALYSGEGRKRMEAAEGKEELKYDTPIRMHLDPGGFETQLNYGLLKKLFTRAGAQLTSQVFLMIYGNFEAYLLDMTADGLRTLSDPNPEEEAIQLIMGTAWRGKFDRIDQRLGIKLGKRLLVNKFRDLGMGFLGEKCDDPVDFLASMAELRHRLVHSTGRGHVPSSGVRVRHPIDVV